MVEDVRPRVEDRIQCRARALKVGRQDFDDGLGQSGADRADGAGEVPCPAVRQVVARHARDDDVAEAQPSGGFGDRFRFVLARRAGVRRRYRAKPARAGARFAENQKCRRPARVTFGEVRTVGARADGREAEVGQQAADACGLVARRDALADPRREPPRAFRGRCFRPHALLPRRAGFLFGRFLRDAAGPRAVESENVHHAFYKGRFDLRNGDLAPEELLQTRHAAPANAARHNEVEVPEVHRDVQREAVIGNPAGDSDADGRHLLVAHPHAREPRGAPALDAEPRQETDQHLLQVPQVPMDIAAVKVQPQNRVAHDLAGPVIGDVAAAARFADLDAFGPKTVARGYNVVATGPPAEGDHGRDVLDDHKIG